MMHFMRPLLTSISLTSTEVKLRLTDHSSLFVDSKLASKGTRQRLNHGNVIPQSSFQKNTECYSLPCEANNAQTNLLMHPTRLRINCK